MLTSQSCKNRSRDQGSGEEWRGDKREGGEEEEMGEQAGVSLFSQENSPVTSRLCLLKFPLLWIVLLVEIRLLAHGPSEDTHI